MKLKTEKLTLGICMYKIWQILKCFTGTFRRAQTLKLGGVDAIIYFFLHFALFPPVCVLRGSFVEN